MNKKSFHPKTLEGNWFEERCTQGYDLTNKSATYMKHPLAGKFVTSSTSYGEFTKEKDPILQDTKFFGATENWMNFQTGKVESDETFRTTAQQDFTQPKDQESKFKLKDNALTKDQKALDEYKAKWTTAGHNFNRTYLGAKKFQKVNQDGK